MTFVPASGGFFQRVSGRSAEAKAADFSSANPASFAYASACSCCRHANALAGAVAAASGCRHIHRSRTDARAARDAGAPTAWPRLRVQEERKHTDIGSHREHAGSPASRALPAFQLAPHDPRWTDFHRFGVRPPRLASGEFGKGSARTPVTRSRRAGTMRLGPPALPRSETRGTGPKPPVRMMVRVATRPSRGLERIGI